MTIYDLIIENGKIIDGTGTPAFYADLAIQGEQIIKIGNLKNMASKKKIDAKGLVVCPGFIDPHSHFDLLLEYFSISDYDSFVALVERFKLMVDSSVYPFDDYIKPLVEVKKHNEIYGSFIPGDN